jgi:hypothetical protein
MAHEEQIVQLQGQMKGISDSLALIFEQLTKMNAGLYGDAENGHIGVIAKQQIQDAKIEDLKKEIELLKDQIREKDIATKAKFNFGKMLLEGVKWGGLIYLLISKAVDLKDVLFHI